MKLKIILIFTLSLLCNLTYAKNNDVRIFAYVNGLVCDFCARALEKTFQKEESVKSINVDLKEKLITINLNENKKIANSTIIKLINDAGYDVREIKYE